MDAASVLVVFLCFSGLIWRSARRVRQRRLDRFFVFFNFFKTVCFVLFAFFYVRYDDIGGLFYAAMPLDAAIVMYGFALYWQDGRKGVEKGVRGFNG